MALGPLYVGIDLGTTNSTAAVFDGEKVTLIRSSQGATLTPSVVRIDARGGVTVGARARRFLESDPGNTRSEFKRLMGTGQGIEFAAAKVKKKPEELAAEVLKSLRADVKEHLGFLPTRAVVSVPALFELPQSAATSEAARLAGFEKVELIQEPVASALAAGWSADDPRGSWLVYDFGGGTFDVSLLETRDGLLRVVGHDGDNFLGGRDFDWVLVDWVLAELQRTQGVTVSRSDPRHAGAVRKLKLAVEEAKIELTRAAETSLVLPGAFEVDGAPVDVDLVIAQSTLEGLCAPLIDRSIEVCKRLLSAHGLKPSQLGRIVLVGGPTVTPALRARVRDALGVPFGEGLDPMTLVAQGAAIYAATAGLDARGAAAVVEPGRRVWLQYPAMSSDLTPHVVGRLVDAGPSAEGLKIRLTRSDGLWSSPEIDVDAEGAFVVTVDLLARRPNVFTIEATGAGGAKIKLSPSSFTIVQGLTISDPPLSRTVGVARADDTVRVFFERGAPLPRAARSRCTAWRAWARDPPAACSRSPSSRASWSRRTCAGWSGRWRSGARPSSRASPPARRSTSRSSSIAAGTSRRGRWCRCWARSSSTSPTCWCPRPPRSRSPRPSRPCAPASRSCAPTPCGATRRG